MRRLRYTALSSRASGIKTTRAYTVRISRDTRPRYVYRYTPCTCVRITRTRWQTDRTFCLLLISMIREPLPLHVVRMNNQLRICSTVVHFPIWFTNIVRVRSSQYVQDAKSILFRFGIIQRTIGRWIPGSVFRHRNLVDIQVIVKLGSS